MSRTLLLNPSTFSRSISTSSRASVFHIHHAFHSPRALPTRPPPSPLLPKSRPYSSLTHTSTLPSTSTPHLAPHNPDTKAKMTLSLYEITIPVFIQHLKTLSKLLEKGVKFTKEEGASVSEEGLADARLVADMGNLVYQIQRVSDTGKGVAQRIGGVENTPMEDNEKTFPDMLARVQKTIDVLEKVKEQHINAQEDTEVIIKQRSGELKLSGRDYVINFAIPNFYFHFTTAYALLRMKGVDVGKNDYLGRN